MRFDGRRVEDKYSDNEGVTTQMSAEDAAKETVLIQAGARLNNDSDEHDEIFIDPEKLKRVRDIVSRKIDSAILKHVERKVAVEQITPIVSGALDELSFDFNAQEQHVIATNVIDDMVGIGPLEKLLDDPKVTEIVVNDYKTIFVEEAGHMKRSNVRFRDDEHVQVVAKRIARSINRVLDERVPFVDARLPDGSRVNIVLPPIALDGTSISIRKFPKDSLSLRDLYRFGAMSAEMAQFIECIAAARCNIVVSGGTSSGKTTILNCLGKFIRQTERVVTIEDSAELKIPVDNLVRLETRPETPSSTASAITQKDLVKNALRMRPDRIILGEVRGAESFDLLNAMMTGHDGSMGTLHSNNPRETTTRLQNMILQAGFSIPTQVVREQIVGAIDFIIHAARGADGKRRIVNITEVAGLEGETISLQDIFYYQKSNGKKFNSGEFVSNSVNLRCAHKLKEYNVFEKAAEAVMDSKRASEG